MRSYRHATDTPSVRTRCFDCKVIRQKGGPDHPPDIGLSRCLHRIVPNVSAIATVAQVALGRGTRGLLFTATPAPGKARANALPTRQPPEALSVQVALNSSGAPYLHGQITIAGRGIGEARVPMAGPWPAGDSRPRSHRGPRVKPFTPDPIGPSLKVSSCHRNDHPERSTSEGPMGSGRAAGLTLGGRLRTIRASLSRTRLRHRHNPLSRASRPARSRSGAGASAGRSKRRRVRAVSARLEAVQKVIITRK